MNKKIDHKELFRMLLFLLTAAACMLTFALVMPFGDGPDEINRYKIVDFIFKHGGLPAGQNPEVLIAGYGASYAFQPMLTYIIDGYLLRALSFLSLTLLEQVFISRCVNICFGLIMAIYVRKISKLLFSDSRLAWAFTLAVVFLPQNLFVHSYVNTDSMGFLSVAIIIYAMILGTRDDYSLKACLNLAAGVILCALSYYNCYGIVLCAVILFLFHFLKKQTDAEGKVHNVYDYASLLKKGGLITLLVLLGISWWFIRNALLYNGDFLALDARKICAASTCREEYNPFTRDTYASLGTPVFDMIFKTDYYTLVWKSFIAMFGPMLIPTHHYIYMSFKYLCIFSLIGLILPIASPDLTGFNKRQRISLRLIMGLAALIPALLAVYYSYTWEFQPQGRYFLPLLIPLMYFLSIGIGKIFSLPDKYLAKKQPRANELLTSFMYHVLYLFLTASLLYSVFVSFLKYYKVY